MKGTLHKTESGWQVWYYAKDDLFYGNTGVRILPLIDSDYYEVNRPGQYNIGKEVEFEIIKYPNPPHNPTYHSIDIAAKLIDKAYVPMKGGEGWDKILNKAIEDKAEDFTNGHYHYRGKDAFIHGYKQGQENTKAMRYTEEDMRELYTYAKRDDSNLEDYLQALNKQDNDWITMKEGDITVNFKPMPEFNEPKYPKVNIICPRCEVLMPCECNPTRQTSLLNSIRDNSSWDTIFTEFHIATQQVEKGAPPLIFECWLVDNYNPPTKKQDNGNN
jgi:hypothetical protein